MQRNRWQRCQLLTSERRSHLAPATTQHETLEIENTLGAGQTPQDGAGGGLEEVAPESPLTLAPKCREYPILSVLFDELIASLTLSPVPDLNLESWDPLGRFHKDLSSPRLQQEIRRPAYITSSYAGISRYRTNPGDPQPLPQFYDLDHPNSFPGGSCPFSQWIRDSQLTTCKRMKVHL